MGEKYLTACDLEAVEEVPTKRIPLFGQDKRESLLQTQQKRLSYRERQDRVSQLLKPFISQGMAVPGTIVITPKVRQNSLVS